MFFAARTEIDIAAFHKHTLILPSVSVGNLGQLAVDILINTLSPERIGFLYDESLVPIIGNNPYTDKNDHCLLTTSCDVYWAREEKLIIVQQRAPFVKGKRKLFREKLLQWIKDCKFTRTVLISSTFAHLRNDRQIFSSQLRYWTTDKGVVDPKDLDGWLELEETPDYDGVMGRHIPGSGIAKTLHDDCTAHGVPLLVLLMFCSEGDNAPDALFMVRAVNKLLHLTNKPDGLWKIPPSWSLNYGSRFQEIIY